MAHGKSLELRWIYGPKRHYLVEHTIANRAERRQMRRVPVTHKDFRVWLVVNTPYVKPKEPETTTHDPKRSGRRTH